MVVIRAVEVLLKSVLFFPALPVNVVKEDDSTCVETVEFLPLDAVLVPGFLVVFTLVVSLDCPGLVSGLVSFVLLVSSVDEIEIVGVGMLAVVVEVIPVLADVFVAAIVCVNVIGVLALFGIEVFVVVSVLVVIVAIVAAVESSFKTSTVENDKLDAFTGKFPNRIFPAAVSIPIADFTTVFNEELVIFLFSLSKTRTKLTIMLPFRRLVT